ncbi:hypothetical protein DRB96_27495 [Streptomyces sp. ICC1]|nr:hypothetical protein DRB89_26875 [Streptomyces sp. ICC4]AWZ15385.1 hypothetical protein DRB96_27495 [Streptomyces sp. ICC1]
MARSRPGAPATGRPWPLACRTPAAVVCDSMSMSLLYVVFFAIGTAETLYDSSTAAWLPTLVEPKDLARANGRLQTTYVICNEFVGPPVGGFIFAAAAFAPFALGTAGYLAAVGLLALIPAAAKRRQEAEHKPLTVRSVKEDIGVGARWYWSSPMLRAMSLVAAAGNAASAASYGILSSHCDNRSSRTTRGSPG